MSSRVPPPARALGLWSAALCTLLSLAYVVAQLAEWLDLLGSVGGPHSRSTSLGLAVLLTPSLLLGGSFVVLMVAVHSCAQASERAWTHIAIAFATIYATLTGIVYATAPSAGSAGPSSQTALSFPSSASRCTTPRSSGAAPSGPSTFPAATALLTLHFHRLGAA